MNVRVMSQLHSINIDRVEINEIVIEFRTTDAFQSLRSATSDAT